MPQLPSAPQPGARLSVTRDNPNGTDLKTGDLVTVIATGIHMTDGLPVPVVQVSTGFGPLMLTFDAVTPVPDASLIYTPGEPDDVVNEFFFRILGNDDDLRDWAVTARTELAKNDGQATPTQPAGQVLHRGVVGAPYTFSDPDGDAIEVVYYEQECPSHGRKSGFHFSINEEEEVIIPAVMIDGLIRFLWHMKKHSERPEGE